MLFWLTREEHTHTTHGSQRTPSSRFHLGIISVPGIWMRPLVLVGVKKGPCFEGPRPSKTEVMAKSSDATSFLELLFTFFGAKL